MVDKTLSFISLGFIFLFPLLVVAQGTVKITSGVSIKATGNALITFENMHLSNDGTLALVAGNGTVRFSGNLITNISGTNQPQFDVLQVAKTGSSQLQLNRNITVVTTLSFVSGLLNLNNNNVELQSTGSVTGESETNRMIGSNGGYIFITKNLNAPSSSNPGNLGAIITSSQNLGSTIIRRGHQMQIGTGMSSSILRYYDIIPSNNIGLNATLRFNYFDAELNGLIENDLRLMKSPDNFNWASQGFTSKDAITNYVEKAGIPGFSRWTLSVFGPLPVRLLTFTASKIPTNKVLLQWTTENEVNNNHFDIQQSTNGIQFVKIGEVLATANPSVRNNYSFTHLQPVKGNNYYRLKQVDNDDRLEFSGIRKVLVDEAGFKIYPHPATEILFMEFDGERTVSISVFDVAGKRIYTIPSSRGTIFRIQVREWPAGVYFLNVADGVSLTSTVFIKQ